MVERVIYALIYICGIALCRSSLPVLGAIGRICLSGSEIPLVVLVLVAILILWRIFAGAGIRWWPNQPEALMDVRPRWRLIIARLITFVVVLAFGSIAAGE
jgi:hypothetical protein